MDLELVILLLVRNEREDWPCIHPEMERLYEMNLLSGYQEKERVLNYFHTKRTIWK